ncbi:MAG: prepilin-type N-terminal cleavage/methylation domain-containing protein [Gammaproteobacteria bacterium]|nr:prepilin-type N-terminal cleavage/methylation domain-containing protein [Gammaproteobacteria bacterium]MCW5584327.1 prepilin-type N-terminal cleavage/methylation domain-containing protein [Gammaproteobacteria bacterium]
MRRFQDSIDGFTIIELLIVIVIIGIVAAVAIPTYVSYVRRAYFSEVIGATVSYKHAVESCYQTQGGGTVVVNCGNNSNGVPAEPPATEVVASVTTTGAGVITAIGQGKAGTDTYILTPTLINGVLAWEVSGTCVAAGTC